MMERNPLVAVLDRLVDHPVDGRRDQAGRDQRDQRRRGGVGLRRDPEQDVGAERGQEQRPDQHHPEVAELDPAGGADPVLVLDGLEHRRLLQWPQSLAVAAGEHRDEEGRPRGEVVGAEVGVGDEAGEDEDVHVADDPHREHERNTDRTLAVDLRRLREVERGLPARAQGDQGEERRQRHPDRLAEDRPLDAHSGDQQRHHGRQGQHRPRHLDGDVGVGAPLNPDRDRGEPEDGAGAAEQRRVDDQGRVLPLAEQQIGDRLAEDERQRGAGE